MSKENDKEFEKVKKFIIKTTDRKQIDNILKTEVKNTDRELKVMTPKDTGDTRRAWMSKKLGELYYAITNDVKRTWMGKSWLAIDLLENGRQEVRPKYAKVLYIPLTNAGKARQARTNPLKTKKGKSQLKNLEYGVDYIFAKKSKSVEGLHFMKDIIPASERSLLRKITKYLTEGK